mmetsp:Transcript_18216/g.27163  ORF Transcript_18216/g.27163 Transcript_18216/m.27163 type:complete len:461 (-) Transcript_18216:188-1570(-)
MAKTKRHHLTEAPILCMMVISFLSRSAVAAFTTTSSSRCTPAFLQLRHSIRLCSTNNDSSTDENTTTSDTWQNPRSRWARKKHFNKLKMLKEQEEQEKGSNKSSLDWDSFDFSDRPKMDKRFKNKSSSPSDETGIPEHVLNTISTDSITYQTYLQSEKSIDQDTSRRSLESQSEILSLSPDIVKRSIDILTPYIQDRRMERIDEVLNQRTKHTRFLYENPSNPSNVFACLRTLDSFGIQYVDTIVQSDSYQGKAAVNQKRGMRTAMGSAVWMSIRQFGSLEDAVRHLREEEGCLIYASDLNPSAKDVRDLVWDVDFDDDNDVVVDGELTGDGVTDGEDGKMHKKQRPICIVMGNEDRGISDEMRELADETFYLPMCGFAESFNLSVATAITLAYMSAVSTRAGDEDSYDLRGPLRPGDLDSHELQCLRLRGVLNSLAQRRMGKALLKKEGIVLPKSFFNF